MSEWNLRCGLCGADAEEVRRGRPYSTRSDLVLLQEHAMKDHGLTQEHIMEATREPFAGGGYQWRLSDGRLYLVAVEIYPSVERR